MAKKALNNLIANGVVFEKGKIYTDEQTAGLDPAAFEDCSEQPTVEKKEVEIEVTPPDLDSATSAEAEEKIIEE